MIRVCPTARRVRRSLLAGAAEEQLSALAFHGDRDLCCPIGRYDRCEEKPHLLHVVVPYGGQRASAEQFPILGIPAEGDCTRAVSIHRI